MKTINLVQGTPEWHAHRAQHLNASDAPAMMGCSPYKTRAQLIREVATVITPEVDAATQRRFDDGHRFEELARPLAEQIIGEELYPCTGVLEGTRYSASFDGLTMLGDAAFEHKSLNDRLRAVMVDGCTGADLPLDYQVQMEQQAMVSGAERILFMATSWDSEGALLERRECWYTPNPELRAKIVAGWEQFEKDVAAYEPEPAAAPVAPGRAPDALPSLRVEVTGMVTASNLAEFKASAMQVLGSINRDLQTDEDFADAEQTVKWCKGVEDRLAATKDAVLAQTADIETVFRTMDEVSAETRRIRLELDKLVKAEKENRKAEIVKAGVQAVMAHLDQVNATMGAHAVDCSKDQLFEISAAIKGKRTIASIRDAVDTAVAGIKIEISQRADLVRYNREQLRPANGVEGTDWIFLFPDFNEVGAKSKEDFHNLVTARVSEHNQREAEKLEIERQRIRQEEAERVERERAAAEVAAQKEAQVSQQQENPETAPESKPEPPAPAQIPTTSRGARIKLGDINAALAPLSITAAGLSQFGFEPVAKKGNAQLYAADDFPRMCAAIAMRVSQAASRLDLPEAA